MMHVRSKMQTRRRHRRRLSSSKRHNNDNGSRTRKRSRIIKGGMQHTYEFIGDRKNMLKTVNMLLQHDKSPSIRDIGLFKRTYVAMQTSCTNHARTHIPCSDIYKRSLELNPNYAGKWKHHINGRTVKFEFINVDKPPNPVHEHCCDVTTRLIPEHKWQITSTMPEPQFRALYDEAAKADSATAADSDDATTGCFGCLGSALNKIGLNNVGYGLVSSPS